jgi:hypothetical protein
MTDARAGMRRLRLPFRDNFREDHLKGDLYIPQNIVLFLENKVFTAARGIPVRDLYAGLARELVDVLLSQGMMRWQDMQTLQPATRASFYCIDASFAYGTVDDYVTAETPVSQLNWFLNYTDIGYPHPLDMMDAGSMRVVADCLFKNAVDMLPIRQDEVTAYLQGDVPPAEREVLERILRRNSVTPDGLPHTGTS